MPPKRAECHPERKHCAKGLCDLCWQRQWRSANPTRIKVYNARRTPQQRAIYNARNRERRKLSDPTFERETKLRQRYGLSIDRWETMLLEQNGCAVCHTWEGQMHVDHDHKSGVVRGICCENCNRGLGMFQDRPDLLRQAAIYLEAVSGGALKEVAS